MNPRFAAAVLSACLSASAAYAQPLSKARADSLGDALPDGAVLRLGTTRMRHLDYVRHFAFSWDAKKAFSLSNESQHVTVWDLSTGKELEPLVKFDKDELQSFTLSADRTVLAAIGSKTIQVWNTKAGKKIADFACESKEFGFTFKDNSTLVAIDESGSLEFWDVMKGKRTATRNLLANFQKPKEVESSLDFLYSWQASPDVGIVLAHLGHRLAFQPRHGKPYIPGRVVVAWDTTTGKELWRQVGEQTGSGFMFSPDGKWFAKSVTSGNPHGELVCCETAAGKVTARLALDIIASKVEILRSSAGAMAATYPQGIAPDGKTIAISRRDGRVFLWGPTGKQPIREIAVLGDSRDKGIPFVDFSPDGKWLLAEIHGHLYLKDLATGQQPFSLPGHRGGVSYLAFSEDGRSLVSGNGQPLYHYGSGHEEILTWILPAGKQSERSQASVLMKSFGLQTISDNHEMGLASNADGMVFLELQSGKSLGKLKVETSGRPFMESFFSPQRRHFVLSSSKELPAAIIDTKTGRELCQLPADWYDYFLAFSPDEEHFACPDKTGVIHVAKTATGKPIATVGRPGPRSALEGVPDGLPGLRSAFERLPLAFSPDGQFLALWDHDASTVAIWRISTAKEYSRLRGKDFNGYGPNAVVCWSPDGRMLAEVGTVSNNAIRLWEVSTGKLRREISGHLAKVNGLAFSPDGRYLASGSNDTTVLVWDLWDRY